MDKYNSKSILRKYRLSFLGFIYTAAIFAFLILFLTNNALLFILSVLLFFLFRRITGTFFFNKYINSILFDELNPLKYNAVFECGKIVSNHLFEKIDFAYYTGDYQTVINICTAKLKDPKQNRYKYWYMHYLARAYFDAGDFENLRLIYDKFQIITEADANCEKLRNQFLFFKFIGLYLSGEFLECKAFYENLLSNTKFNSSKTPKLNVIQTKYTYAIACYKSNDLETATEIFNYIITEAPQLNFAAISQKYLNAIENSEEYQSENITINTDENFVVPTPGKSIKIRKIVALILAVLIFICMWGATLFKPDEPIHFRGLDSSTMRSDIYELYGQPDKIEEYVYPAGEFYDVYYAEFLGVKGTLEFKYFTDGNNDDLFVAEFIINSKDFASEKEYKEAVNKTYIHFKKVLSSYQMRDDTDNERAYIVWSRSTDDYAYSMYETQMIDNDFPEGANDCTLFRFNKYLSAKSKD